MTQRTIRFSQHALLKFEVLAAHGLSLEEEMVVHIILNPAGTFEGYRGRKIAQGPLDESRVLRVVYEEKGDDIIIVTFYPGRRQRYEKNQI